MEDNINILRDKFYSRLSKLDLTIIKPMDVVDAFSDSYQEIMDNELEKLKARQASNEKAA